MGGFPRRLADAVSLREHRERTIMTAFLLTSSLTMVLAVRASVQHDAKAQTLWLLATMPVVGSSFCTGASGAI